MGKITDEIKQLMVEAIDQTRTMKEASELCGIPFATFKYRAKQLGLYRPNPSGQRRTLTRKKIDIEEIIFEGKHPFYQSNHLRRRLLKEGYKEHKCESCNLTEWLDQPITLELDHIDGNHHNHLLSNLRVVCPNCHSHSPNWRGKNTGRYD